MTGAGFLLSTVTLQFPTTHIPGGGSRNFLWWFGLIMAAPSGMSSKLHCRRALELLVVTFPRKTPSERSRGSLQQDSRHSTRRPKDPPPVCCLGIQQHAAGAVWCLSRNIVANPPATAVPEELAASGCCAWSSKMFLLHPDPWGK